MAANKLQAVMTNADATFEQTSEALLFNRKLWSIFLSEAQRDENPQPLDVRQNIANIGIFVLSHTAALQISPQRDHFKPLIEINRNIAAVWVGGPEQPREWTVVTNPATGAPVLNTAFVDLVA